MALSTRTWKKRAAEQRLDRLLYGKRRYLDFAIEIRVVSVGGDYRIPGFDSGFTLQSTHRYGGKLDRVTKLFCAPAAEYLPIYMAPKQWEAIQADTTGILVKGGEGSGKTETAAIWLLLQVLSHSACDAGLTAPTTERVDVFVRKILDRIPQSWVTYRRRKSELVFPNGVTVHCRGVKRYSEDVGSRIQGMTWQFCASDEAQDYEESIDADIEARGRGAKKGLYKRFVTLTPKLTALSRDYIDAKQQSPDWTVRTLTGPENVFVAPEHWERLRRNLSDREFLRRVMAENLPPERATYDKFSREHHVRATPWPPNTVTRAITKFDYIVGYDPGVRQNTSVLLEAFQSIPVGPQLRFEKNRYHSWWVTGELVTQRSTIEEHAIAMTAWLANLGVRPGGKTALILVDPSDHFNARTAEHTLSVLRAAGLTAAKAIEGMRIGKEDRIGILNNLFLTASGDSYLFIERRNGECVAPTLLDCLESSVRDESGRAEAEHKSRDDYSHAPSALAYGLYRFEQPFRGSPQLI